MAQSHHYPNPPSQRRKGLHLTMTKERNLQRLKTVSLQHQKTVSPLNPRTGYSNNSIKKPKKQRN